MLRRLTSLAAAVVLVASAGRASAQEGGEQRAPDHMVVRLDADTYLRLFERAALPGPNGALVAQTVAAPLYEYATLRVENIDMPWQDASVDVDFSAWGDLNLGENSDLQRLDGDVTAASVVQRFGWAYAKLGRQVQAGGAARVSRLDGLTLGVTTPWGLGATAYGGWTVLPRWDERPGYYLLGSAADTIMRNPDAIPAPTRSGNWMAGGRLFYSYESYVQAGASFHEQRDNGDLDRRNLGFDVHVVPHKMVAVTGKAILDADVWNLTDARAAVDVYPLDELSLAAEYSHATPSLLLSRTSVLSVFSLDAFDEAGASATVRPLSSWKIGASGYADVFSGSDVGARLDAFSSLDLKKWVPLLLRAEYGWVAEPTNGYHSARISAVFRPIDPLAFTAETYLYFYKAPINNVPLSTVGVLSGEWTVDKGWAVLASGSLARTPYSKIDAQALARLRISQDWELP